MHILRPTHEDRRFQHFQMAGIVSQQFVAESYNEGSQGYDEFIIPRCGNGPLSFG